MELPGFVSPIHICYRSTRNIFLWILELQSPYDHILPEIVIRIVPIRLDLIEIRRLMTRYLTKLFGHFLTLFPINKKRYDQP